MKKLLKFHFFPIIAFFVLVCAYVTSEVVFVKCWFGICEKIQTSNISQVDEKNYNYYLRNIPGILGTKQTEYTTETNRIGVKENEIKATQKELDSTIQQMGNANANFNSATANISVSNTTAVNANSANTAASAANSAVTNAANKARLDKTLGTQRAELKELNDDRDKTKAEIQGIREQVSARYSSRMVWMFLTAIFFLLSIVAIWFSGETIKDSFPKGTNSWLLITMIVAIGFAAFNFFSVIWFPANNYMSVMTPMFSQSLDEYEDLSMWVVNLTNCIGFTATICLVSASSALMSDIVRESSERTTVAEQQSSLTNILYIGASMLFVGMLRFKVLTDWHLNFVSVDQANHFYILLANYFKTSIGVQAAFYSIVLAVIYMPVANVIASDPPPPGPATNLLEKIGLPLPTDLLIKFLTVMSPFLAGPLVELIQFFVGKSG